MGQAEWLKDPSEPRPAKKLFSCFPECKLPRIASQHHGSALSDVSIWFVLQMWSGWSGWSARGTCELPLATSLGKRLSHSPNKMLTWCINICWSRISPLMLQSLVRVRVDMRSVSINNLYYCRKSWNANSAHGRIARSQKAETLWDFDSCPIYPCGVPSWVSLLNLKIYVRTLNLQDRQCRCLWAKGLSILPLADSFALLALVKGTALMLLLVTTTAVMYL